MSPGHLAAVQNHGYPVSFLHIGCARHNLDDLISYIHLTYNQLIRIGMLLDFFDSPYYYFFQILI